MSGDVVMKNLSIYLRSMLAFNFLLPPSQLPLERIQFGRNRDFVVFASDSLVGALFAFDFRKHKFAVRRPYGWPTG